ncbi:hypothetical protein CTAYLR_009754 [Chrysophaeum taylorii]|uniref:FAD-binding domain-containing protein n=1 Tax=Chrysophaeum taylorii TaxID=2483200 RepID=A0AAD7XK57_9STRA|nr:hypothetical protein CTAYLR_009754 [Chrysophaeum taylorii]
MISLKEGRSEVQVLLLVLGAVFGLSPKVGIAGGGVGGLTAAVALQKRGFEVSVYEKTGKFARFGGPIQLASNALSTLKAIDEEVFEEVMAQFTFTGTRRCGIKDGLRSRGFKTSGVFETSYFWDEETPHDWYVTFPLKECADAFELPYTGVVDRPVLQQILLKRVVEANVFQNKTVTSYRNDAGNGGVEVCFADGSRDRCDVLIGADGIWSGVRAQMYYGSDDGSAEAKKKRGCDYSGYTVFAGEAVLDLPDYYQVGYNVYLGPRRYFVKSDVGDGRVQWYAFCGMEPGTKFAGNAWEGEETGSSDVVDYILSLHEGWTPEIEFILRNTDPSTVEQRDLYDRNPLGVLFRPWVDGSVVLLGDAVHPMMPNLGQGGCQAIEDAYELAVALGNSDGDIATALGAYQSKRKPRAAAVTFLSRLASDLIIHAFDTPWSWVDDKGTSWQSYLTTVWKPLLQLVIFPAQFLFLYSYSPTEIWVEVGRSIGAARGTRRQQDLGFAKVADPDLLRSVHQDIRRLEIAMRDATRVHVRDGGGHVNQNVRGKFLVVSRENLLKRPPPKLHHEQSRREVDQPNDVRVPERRQRLGFFASAAMALYRDKPRSVQRLEPHSPERPRPEDL